MAEKSWEKEILECGGYIIILQKFKTSYKFF